MKIELKKISYNARLSEETNCFSASLYVDGVYTAEVSNHGTGGPDDIYPVKGQEARLEAAEAYCKSLPAEEFHGMTLENNLELVMGNIMDRFIAGKDFDRDVKKKVMVLEDGKIMQYGWKGLKQITPAHLEKIKAEKPGSVILNLLPRDEALDLLMKHG